MSVFTELLASILPITRVSFGNRCTIYLIMMFALWRRCGFCKKLRPTYTDLASKLSDAILAKIDCEENEAIKDRFEIRGFPST